MTVVRQDAPSKTPPTYAHLLHAARQLFHADELELLVPRTRGGPRLAEVNGQGAAALDPIAATEAIAYDFLSKGGKYSRPFITLAAYDALTGGHCTRPDGADEIGRPTNQFGPAGRRLHRIVPQGVARSRRHSGRRRVSLRPAALCTSSTECLRRSM